MMKIQSNAKGREPARERVVELRRSHARLMGQRGDDLLSCPVPPGLAFVGAELVVVAASGRGGARLCKGPAYGEPGPARFAVHWWVGALTTLAYVVRARFAPLGHVAATPSLELIGPSRTSAALGDVIVVRARIGAGTGAALPRRVVVVARIRGANAPAWALEVLREHVELAGEGAACPELPVLVCAPVAGDGACGSAIIEVALQDPLVSGVDLATARREIALR